MFASRLFMGLEVPAEDKEVFDEIKGNLEQLGSFVEGLGHALSLFDACRGSYMAAADAGQLDEATQFSAWEMIAARDGAMMIYHFGKVRSVIPGQVKKCGFLEPLIDVAELGKPGNLFEAGFPHWAGVRKGVAHMGDFSKSAAIMGEHGVTTMGEDGQPTLMFASNNLRDRTYFATVDGKAVEYDLSPDTVSKLEDIMALTLAPFEAAYLKLAPPFWLEIYEGGKRPKQG